MILNIANLNKTYVGKQILKGVTFHIEDKEKAAIVGINGSGKTTLIKCILGEEEPDDSETVIALSKGKKIGYLAQQHADMPGAEDDIPTDLTDAKALAMKQEIESYGDDFDTLSGGQKTRKRLEEILLTKPDLLILDEPTNHLDIESIQWLEKVLKRYDGAVLLVSHDRYFLDHVVTKIIDLDNGRARMYRGNYSEYAEKKKQIRDAELKAYYNQQADIAHQQAVIDKLKQFNREKSIKRAESREKALAKVELLDKPEELDNEMRLALTPHLQSGNDVLSVKELSKSFGEKTLFSNISFEIKRGEHVAVIGANGTGKTTLLKILNEQEPASTGSFKLGTNVEIGYYDQEHAVLHMEKTIFDEIQDDYPYLNDTKVRNVLAAFLFRGDDVYKRIGDLSGGEQGRVSLAKLMLSNANFLILDEPTNHLDIQGREVLEDAIRNYEGTVLYVSHDRYFINQTATRILELTGQTFLNYIGNYDYYLEKKDLMKELYVDSEHTERDRAIGTAAANGSLKATGVPIMAKSAAETEVKLDWKAQKEEQARIRKRQNDLKKVEDEIHKLETRDGEIDELLSQEEIYTDVARLVELNNEKESLQKKLEELYETWEELAE